MKRISLVLLPLLILAGCASPSPEGKPSAEPVPTVQVCGSVVTFDTTQADEHQTFEVNHTSITVHKGTTFTYDFGLSPILVRTPDGEVVANTCVSL